MSERTAPHPLDPGEGVPFFIAAGVLKEATHLEPFLKFDDPMLTPVLTSGAWTLHEWAGNAPGRPNDDFVYYPNLEMAGNCRGLPNAGAEGMMQLRPVIRDLARNGIKTIIQVTNLPQERPAEVIPQLAEMAASLEPTAVEVNLSCPNGKRADGTLEPPTCNNPDACAEVMGLVRQRVGESVTIGAKDSPHAGSPMEQVDTPAVSRLVRAIAPTIDFLVGINTIGNQPFPELLAGNGRGGMSGPIVKEVSYEWLRAARAAAPEHVAILSCGGVDRYNLATELPLRLQGGALLVGGAQEFYRTDPAKTIRRWVDHILHLL